MDIRPIKIEADYEWAIAEIARYFDREPKPGSEDALRFDTLGGLIEAYEDMHYPMARPIPWHLNVKQSAKEYARRDGEVLVRTNTIENVFSVFKRGMVGVYQHCGEAHLHRYLDEFDFRYNRRAALKVSDTERADQLLAMIEGKRLTYQRIGEARHA